MLYTQTDWTIHRAAWSQLTLKIQDQGYGWGQRSKSQCESTPIDSNPFGSMSMGHPIPEIQHFQKLTLKILGQGHSWRSQSRYNTLLTHIPFLPCRLDLPFLEYSHLKIWYWKFKVKIMSEVKVENHNMGPTFNWLTSLSFHVNWASHFWVMNI